MSHRNIVASLLVVSGVLAACAASQSGDLSDSPGDAPPPGVTLTPPSGGSSGDDQGSPDAGKDAAKHDASVDAGPPPPEPGTACTKSDQIFSRGCGACGKQEAICQADDTGALKVSVYSSCHDELAGGCTPGDSVIETCGNCGSHTKTCSKYCAWSVTSCKGEPVDSCPAGTVSWTVAGCPTSGTVRSRACSDACTWQSFAACTAPDYSVRAPKAVGATARVIVPLTSAIKAKRVSGTCGSATLSPAADHAVAWVRVVNDGPQKATLSVWNDTAPGGVTMNTVLASYVSQPASDAELLACEKGTGDFCPATLPCGDPSFGALTAANAVVLASGDTRVIGITVSPSLGTVGEVSEGSVALIVRADTLE
jgi:hypothetical protein